MSDDTKEALKTKLLRLQAERREREEREDAEDEPKRLELAIANEEAIAAAVAKIGPVGKAIGTVSTKHGVIIVKKPNHMLVRQFRDRGEVVSSHWEELVRPCVVHPSAEKLDFILEDQPVVLTALGTVVLRLAGLTSAELAGKS